MAGMAGSEGEGPSNVISLALARTARRAPFHWPADGPDAERVAVVALHAAAGEAALVAADGTILAVNRSWLLATPTAEPGTDVYTSWRLDHLDPRDAAQLITGLRSALGGTDGHTHDLVVDGRWLRVVATSLGGTVGGAVLTVAEFDPRTSTTPGRDLLTGLTDRARFVDRIDRARRADDGRAVAVLLVDLLDLTLVDRADGHAVGDQLLVEVGRRLTAAAGDDDVVAHLGGAQFAILARPVARGDEPRVLATVVAERLAAPFPVGDRQVHLGASLGVHIADGDGAVTGEGILRDADAALRAARHVPAGISSFRDETPARALRTTPVEHDRRPSVEPATTQITDRRADQPSMDTQEGHRHE